MGVLGWGFVAVVTVVLADYAPTFVTGVLILIVVGAALVQYQGISAFFGKVSGK